MPERTERTEQTVPTEPCDLSAVEARELIRRRTLSPVELLDSCLARIEQVDPAVNAMVTLAVDRARAEAVAAADLADGVGALHGLPVAIKDLQATEGIRTTYGSEAFADNVPSADAGIVRRIRAAGGIVVGKTNIPERSIGANTVNRLFGATANPFDVELTCGGSSGGSAVALATGMVPLATGSDHGGSLRIPACYTGVVGHRSSPGVVPFEERTTAQTFYSVQGPMARTVADTALLLSVIASRRHSYSHRGERLDPMAFPLDAPALAVLDPIDLGSLRVGVSDDLGGVLVSQPVRSAFADRVERIARLVGECEPVRLDLRGASAVDWRLRSDLFVTQYHTEVAGWDDGFNPNIRRTYESALSTPMDEIAKARRTQMELCQHVARLFRRDDRDDGRGGSGGHGGSGGGVDVVICPGVSVPPFAWRQLHPTEVNGEPVQNYMAWLALTSSITVVGHPVTALPGGLDDGGLPFGLQLIGPLYDDRRLLSIAAALEQAFSADPATTRPTPDLTTLQHETPALRTDGRRVQLDRP